MRREKNYRRALCWGVLSLGLLHFSGCAWFDQTMQKLKGPGFPGWEDANGMRGKNSDVKPSGFFTDTRSEQIEKNLGGNF